MPKFTPFLWFDDKAEEAVNIYTSIFHRVFAHMARWIAKFHGWALEHPVAPRLLLDV
jgi:predicted 3-demethylubiquinone-9 3-methyltransferase (glyoxalase superfamily)